MLEVIKLNKGVIAFYIIVALLALLCVFRMNNLNIVGNNSSDINQVHCA